MTTYQRLITQLAPNQRVIRNGKILTVRRNMLIPNGETSFRAVELSDGSMFREHLSSQRMIEII